MCCLRLKSALGSPIVEKSFVESQFRECRGWRIIFNSARQKKLLITTAILPISRAAQSRTCLWVSADPRFGEDHR
jgi:hypothetical protein